MEEAFSDPQAGALSQYIGKEEVTPDRTYIPLSLFPGDVLLLCSDGISDPLTLKQIREAMELPVQDCCSALEQQSEKPHFPHRITIPQSFYIITGKRRILNENQTTLF